MSIYCCSPSAQHYTRVSYRGHSDQQWLGRRRMIYEIILATSSHVQSVWKVVIITQLQLLYMKRALGRSWSLFTCLFHLLLSDPLLLLTTDGSQVNAYASSRSLGTSQPEVGLLSIHSILQLEKKKRERKPLIWPDTLTAWERAFHFRRENSRRNIYRDPAVAGIYFIHFINLDGFH